MIPLILITIMYFLMLLRLWRSNLVSTSSESQRGKKKVTRLCVVIVIMFMILWMPIQVSISQLTFGYFVEIIITFIYKH